jgi:hypothetical protein
MLLYRKRSSSENMSFVPDTSIPEDLRASIMADSESFLKLKAEWEYERSFLHIKVSHGEKVRVIKVHQTSTVALLTDMVHSEFQDDLSLSSSSEAEVAASVLVSRDCVRLRVYDTIRGVLLAPLALDETTILSSISEQTLRKTLHIETKRPDEIFSATTQETMPFEAVLFHGCDDFDPTLTANYFSRNVGLSISPTATTNELVALVAKTVTGALAVAYDEADVTSQVSLCVVDALSGKAKLVPSSSTDLVCDFVKAGDRVYLDITSSSSSSSSSLTGGASNRLLEYFDNAHNVITMGYINESDPTRHEFRIDQRQSLERLKQRIADAIHSDVSTFSIHKTIAAKPSVELKDLSGPIMAAGLEDGSAIYVLPNPPLLPDQYRLSIYARAELGLSANRNVTASAAEGDNTLALGEDSKVISVRLLGKVVVTSSQTVQQIKSSVLSRYLPQYAPCDVRLRECDLHDDEVDQVKYAEVLQETVPINSATKRLTDSLCLLLEHGLGGTEEYTVDHIWMKISLWKQSTDEITAPIELPVQKNTSVGDLRVKLAELGSQFFKGPDSDSGASVPASLVAENIAFVKPFLWQLKDKSNIPLLKWNPQVNLLCRLAFVSVVPLSPRAYWLRQSPHSLCFFLHFLCRCAVVVPVSHYPASQPREEDTLSGAPWRFKETGFLLIKDISLDPEGTESAVQRREAGPAVRAAPAAEIGFKLYSPQEQAAKKAADEEEAAERKKLIDEKMKHLMALRAAKEAP